MLDFPPFSKIQDLKELIHSGLIIVEIEAIHVLEQEVEGMSEGNYMNDILNLMDSG